jgi:hypothetical protein
VYYSLEPGLVERFLAIAGELMPLPSGDSAAFTPSPEVVPPSRNGGS